MNGSAGDDGEGASRKLEEIRGAGETAEPFSEDEGGQVVRLAELQSKLAASPEIAPDVPAAVIDPKAPLRAARTLIERDHTLGGVRVLHHWRDNFYRWNGSCYEILGEQEVRNLAYAALEASLRATAKSRRAAGKEPEPLNPNRAMATALDGRIEPPAWLGPVCDRPPAGEFVAARNGLVHLSSRELWPPDPSFFVLTAAPVDFDPEVPEPAAWLAFLRQLWGDDEASIRTLQEIVGCLLAGETAQQKIFLLVGPTRSGSRRSAGS